MQAVFAIIAKKSHNDDNMSVDAFVAMLTTVCSVVVKVVGLPDQMRANYRRKSTEGLSSWFLIFTLISYSMWVLHGLLAHDMSLVIGQGLGAVATAVIIGQAVMYKHPRSSVKPAKPTMLWYAAMLQRRAMPPKSSRKSSR